MNNVDKQYLGLVQDVIDNGVWKNTRSGRVKSVFGRTMRFNLKEGLPLLTTKKIFTKGIIHELIWFLNGDTNIKYLVDNGVNIWTDDAYRWYKHLVKIHNENIINVWGENSSYVETILTKEEFLVKVRDNKEKIALKVIKKEKGVDYLDYNYGDLGDVYGKQWRSYGITQTDQIKNIVDKLQNNPDDRRIMCVAYNPDVLGDVALPPCHTMFQFYTRELSIDERSEIHIKNTSEEEIKTLTESYLDGHNIPKYELSCSFTMRSNDLMLGNPFNIAQYATLTEMLAHVCNMTVGALIYNCGDVHIYENHIELAKEQLTRNGVEKLPNLMFMRKVKSIDDFKFEDFIINGYVSDSVIKFPLSVG